MDKIRVLLADDHAIVRAGLLNALKEVPNLSIVREVGDGLALMQGLVDEVIDVLLVDITMPNFNPIKDIRKIRADYPALKILVVSAYDDDVYVQGLLNAGVNGYHMKDQPLSDLQLAVQRVIEGERWVSSRLLDKLLMPAKTLSIKPLSERKQEILQLLLQGLDNLAIARKIGISVKTVENHLTKLYRQLGVQSRLEAVNFARENPELLDNVQPSSISQSNFPLAPVNTQPIILLIDDNQRFRSQLARLVSRLITESAVFEAEDSTSALRKAKTVSPQLIFVDVVLGDEDGIRCADKLRRQHPDARIVLMSAYPDREFRSRAIKAGANAFLDKKDLDSAAMKQILTDVFNI